MTAHCRRWVASSLRPALVVLLLVAPAPAWSTWSIVAVDAKTGEVGSAGASCTGFVAGILGVAPGRGVIVAQARSNRQARQKGVEMLLDGHSPEAVVTAISDPAFDPDFQAQQYGVAALGFEEAPAVFTGADTAPWRGHATAEGVAVQGNILTEPEVLETSLAAFREARSEPLAERLLRALEAGSAAGGDKRCGEQRALSAYLVVARSGETPDSYSVRIIVPGQRRGGPNPVEIVRQRFDRSGED